MTTITAPRPAAPVVRPPLSDVRDELSLLIAKRGRMPHGHPERHDLCARIQLLAAQVEWADQWASQPSDLAANASIVP